MKEINIEISEHKRIKEQGDLFGIFLEDLNHAVDGGLYGEMVRNRSFEFSPVDCKGYHELTAWESVERGDSVVQNHVETMEPIVPENPHYLTMEVITDGEGGGIRNEGYNSGLFIEAGKEYYFSCWCRRRSGTSALTVSLEDKEAAVCYGKLMICPDSREWKRYEGILHVKQTDHSARLAILSVEPVIVDLDMISLFPAETFLGRKNGLRADIAQMLADMKPKFLRFPGGCLIHIGSLNAKDRSCMYRWKNTIGPVEQRPSRRNTWNYNQTFGIGFYEFFQFCEDIGAEPLPVIAVGYDPHYLRMAPLNQMQEWIDEALDLIEFANGEPDTVWGAKRAEMGHPESFHMKYLGIGNEEVGDAFFERYEIILKAVKEKYPDIEVISSAGPGSAGSEFQKGWEQARRTPTSYVDEHFYQCPEWFLGNANRYENYPALPKAFLGEYASQDDTWYNALAEAAFMTGLEKEKGIGLACYAPLLHNVGYSNWKPDLLSYDNYRVYGSPSYYVQKLFMNHQGDYLLAAADDLEKRQRGPVSMRGYLAMTTNQAEVEISGMAVRNLETGEITMVDDFMISKENSCHRICDLAAERYEVSFRFRKKNGKRSGNLNGVFNFDLEFAAKDADNKFRWTIDGWQRLTSLSGICGGKTYDCGLHLFESQVQVEYKAKMTVDQGRVRTYIDGNLYCNHMIKDLNAESLYYSALKDENGDLIIKAVNAEQSEKLLKIRLEETHNKKVTVYAMEGFQKEDRNSFEEPQKVAPVIKEIEMRNGKLEYKLPGESLAVLRISSGECNDN